MLIVIASLGMKKNSPNNRLGRYTSVITKFSSIAIPWATTPRALRRTNAAGTTVSQSRKALQPAEHAERYVREQHLNLPRKSTEPIADEAGIDPRALQKFLGGHRWDDRLMTTRLQQTVMRDHAHSQAIGIVDESSFAKKGDKTPGVQRQHCGSTGKLDNCVVTTHLAYATPEGFHTLLSSALFLPEDWSNDRERCRRAGIPEDLVYRPKWRIALELHQEAQANGIRLAWFTADEFYGRPVEFHLELSRRGQQ